MNFIFKNYLQFNDYNTSSDNKTLMLINKNKSYGVTPVIPDDLIIKQYFTRTKYTRHVAFYDSFPGYKNADYEL
jgi:hypothetical protein